MAEVQPMQQDVRTQPGNLPGPKQVSLADRRQEEELREKQTREIRKSYVVHPRTGC